METKIRTYIDELFAGTTPSRKSVELKEEMIQNLTEKYNDLLSEGKTPEAAYNIAIAGIGDVSDLLKDLEKDTVHPQVVDAYRQRSAMLTAISIMMYIVSVVPLIVLAAIFHTPAAAITGVAIMFFLIAGATGLLIYNGMTKPKFHRNETMVEDFKQWQSGSQDQRALRKAMSTALWVIAAAAYLIIGATTDFWHPTWIIFVIAAAVQALMNAAFTLKK